MPHKTTKRSGQAVILITMSLFFIFSVMGLAVDMGFSYMKRQNLQAAADSAALAAAAFASKTGGTCTTSVPCGNYTCANPIVTPATTALQAGCAYASANGFVNGGNGGKQIVTMSGNTTAPANAPGMTTATYWVKATISEKMPGLFMYWAGYRTDNVAVEATAAIASNTSTAGNCIYVLNPTAASSLLINGSENITGDCGIYVNSSSQTAAVINGSNTINVSQFKIVGNYTNNGSNSLTPSPTIGAAAVADPLASLPAPTYSNTCDQTNYSLNSSGTATLNPGVYCGGITINGSYTVTFNPGTYILLGGGFNNNGSSTLNGSGVFFYNTYNSTYAAAAVTFNGSATINLTAPTSGTYKGILFFQDRSIAYGAFTDNFNGSSSGTTGTLYFPTTALIYNGSQTAQFQAVICSTLTFNGSTNLKKDTTGTYTGLAKSSVGLIE